jgi:hypothetical protein
MAHSPNGKSEELSESYWLRVIQCKATLSILKD